eukprot:scaffold119624_cov24-Phaeocystis_antarctica.AAC.1
MAHDGSESDGPYQRCADACGDESDASAIFGGGGGGGGSGGAAAAAAAGGAAADSDGAGDFQLSPPRR